MLDNITLYWLSRTGASSARLYWESIAEVTELVHRAPVASPSPYLLDAPSSRRRYHAPTADGPNLGFPRSSTGEPARGGHSAPGNSRTLFISEVRAVAEALDRWLTAYAFPGMR